MDGWMGVLVDGWSRYSSQRLLVDSSSEANKDLYIEQVNTCIYIYIYIYIYMSVDTL